VAFCWAFLELSAARLRASDCSCADPRSASAFKFSKKVTSLSKAARELKLVTSCRYHGLETRSFKIWEARLAERRASLCPAKLLSQDEFSQMSSPVNASMLNRCAMCLRKTKVVRESVHHRASGGGVTGKVR
jgi:hypothetical protein